MYLDFWRFDFWLHLFERLKSLSPTLTRLFTSRFFNGYFLLGRFLLLLLIIVVVICHLLNHHFLFLKSLLDFLFFLFL